MKLMQWRVFPVALAALVAGAAAQEPSREEREAQRRRALTATDPQMRQQAMARIAAAAQSGAVHATANYVFVLRGDLLMQLRASDLEPLHHVSLPPAPEVAAIAGSERALQMLGSRFGAALFANDEFVYVLRGNTIFQFQADTLEQRHKAVLPDPFRAAEPRADQPRPERQ